MFMCMYDMERVQEMSCMMNVWIGLYVFEYMDLMHRLAS